jgi:hypothetical protein
MLKLEVVLNRVMYIGPLFCTLTFRVTVAKIKTLRESLFPDYDLQKIGLHRRPYEMHAQSSIFQKHQWTQYICMFI